MRVLGIETSCDETGVAVFEAGRGIRAERLASQVAIHAAFGGVVPELASRDHIAKLLPMVQGAAVAAARADGRSLVRAVLAACPGLGPALARETDGTASSFLALRERLHAAA